MCEKLIKYLKRLVSIFLIFSMMFSSYGAVTSSDGSAFITKDEFDLFSEQIVNRLDIFEAGVNSKIDSQITTYLDRNGIWSGKYEKLSSEWTLQDANTGTYKRKSRWNTGYGNNGNLSSNTSSDSTANWIYQYGFVDQFNSKNMLAYKLIDKINKSGLMCFTIKMEPNDSSKCTGFILALQYSTGSSMYGGAAPNISVDMVWSEEEYANTTLPSSPNEKARIRMTTGDFTLPRTADISSLTTPGAFSNMYAFANMHISLGKQNVYFFVNKGKSLWIYYNFVMSYKANTSKSNFSDYKSNAKASAGNANLYLDYYASACVY